MAPDEIHSSDWVIAYPQVRDHGIIGDRRTAALVAADGTVDWLCAPDFDGHIVFGALLDWSKGGHWRIGPQRRIFGQQQYLGDSMVLETRWDMPEANLVLHDSMLWPGSKRVAGQEQARVLVRRIRCNRGSALCDLDLQVRYDFQGVPASFTEQPPAFALALPELQLRLFLSRPPVVIGSKVHLGFELHEGEEFWAVLDGGHQEHVWSAKVIEKQLAETCEYWSEWVGRLGPTAHGDPKIRRTAMMVHLLTYAPEGSVAAAPTTSVPERIGGGWNVDYRLCWVRDASLSLGILARLGNLHETEQYLQWLVGRLSLFGRPLQVLYDLRGGTRPVQRKLSDVAGYRHSQPVRLGNHAYRQHQLGSYGYAADCIWTYLQEGGPWRDGYWKLTCRLANYTVKHWHDEENGVWELPQRCHYVSSKVLSWVMLERAVRIARKVKPGFDSSSWQTTADAIHAEVMERGWSERLGAFRQHYDADTLDAASLLISVFDFLPSNHPRVLSTIERISECLTIGGFVYRFNPLQTPGLGELPLGEFEGAFFPSTFWLATASAKAGDVDRAESILQSAEEIAGPLGIFPEAVDARSGSHLGNTPLLFSDVEYVRAKLELDRVRNQQPRVSTSARIEVKK